MKIFKLNSLLFAAIIAIFSSLITPCDSYSQFGQNKVQYRTFDWQYIQSKHFDVYFYQGGDYIAQFTAQVAESSLVSLNTNFDYKISNRIPIVVFNSHNEFQQNNVVDQYLPEGIGGVTELFKNRIVIPFEGDYEKFRHVIHHELVHAYMNDMYYGGSIQNIISKNITLAFPLWFSEGMAEVQSLDGLDKATDMFMRDAVINNYLPPLEYNNGFLAYRGGQSFFAFLENFYGRETIGELMNNIKGFGNVDAGFRETYKLSVEKLGEKWQKELKKTYWPGIKSREEVEDFAKQLTDHEKEGGFYNVSPTISPDGKYYAFISNRDDLFDVFLGDANTGKEIDKLVSGTTSITFEELQILTPGLSWAPDGRRLAISVKAGDRDAIYIINSRNGDTKKLPVKSNNISYVSWSPIGGKLAYVGMNTKQSDIYIYDLATGVSENLTNDIFSESSPTWSPDGRYVYFTSDRGDYVESNMIPPDFKMYEFDFTGSDIYRVDINTRNIIRETKIKNSKQSYAQISPDGKKMLYISDVNGISNLYLRYFDSSGATVDKPITNSLNPIDQISLSKDGKKLLFVSLNKGGYDIYSIHNPFDRDIGLEQLEPTEYVMNKYGTDVSESSNETIEKDSKIASTPLENSDTVNSIAAEKDDSTNVTEQDTTKGLYGNDIKINFNSKSDTTKGTRYVDSIYVANTKFKVVDNQNSDGSFRIKDYKIKFTPDIVYGNANYSSFYGVQGVATIAFSDLLGNHRIQLLTSMVIDLKNSDYALGYFYLPKRLDLGAEIFHTARFLLYDNGDGNGDELYRYRNFGVAVSASYPFSRFDRVEGSLSFLNITRENLDDDTEPVNKRSLLVPSLSYVHDNTIFGNSYSPTKGARYNLTALGTPKFGETGIGFGSLLADYRTYFKIAEDYTFAWRFAGGASFGPNPQRFYIGGVPNWINREFENNNIPISNIEEYAFSTPGLPLRGFNYDALSGSKYALTNFELRFPIIRYLIFGLLPIGFQNIQGVAFIDAGTAWRDNDALKLISRDSDGNVKTQDLLMGMGFGTRAIFLNFPVKFDIAWNYNLDKFSPPKYYISLGFDF